MVVSFVMQSARVVRAPVPSEGKPPPPATSKLRRRRYPNAREVSNDFSVVDEMRGGHRRVAAGLVSRRAFGIRTSWMRQALGVPESVRIAAARDTVQIHNVEIGPELSEPR